MELAIFLARSWGWFLVLLSLALLFNRQGYQTLYKRIGAELVFLAGVIALGVGVAQTVGYENWTVDWRGLATLLGWLTLLKGLALLFIPTYPETWGKLVMAKTTVYTVSLIVALIVGAYLLYSGYMGY